MAQGTNYVVQIELKAKNMMSGTALKAGKAVKSIGDEFKKLGRSMEFAEAKQILFTAAVKAYQAVKQGAAINQQKAALDGLAKTYGSTGRAITEAMQKSSDYTIDKMSAVTAANKAMILDVAKSPKEFAELAKVATVLGRAMGQDAAKSIDDFVVAAGRQSKLIADNLGLMVSSADANLRWAKTNDKSVKSMTDANKKQAFLQEMLRQGTAKMKEMGDVSGGTAIAIAQGETAFKDMTNSLKSMSASLVENSWTLYKVTEAMQIAAGLAEQLTVINDEKTKQQREANKVIQDAADEQEKWNKIEVDGYWAARDSATAHEQYQKAVDASGQAVRKTGKSQLQLNKELSDTLKLAAAGVSNIDNYGNSLEEMTSNLDIATSASIDFAGEQERIAKAQALVIQKTNEALLDQGMAWTSYFADRTEQRTENVKTIRDIEAEHQANLIELQKKGQSRAISLNANAEQAKLDTLKQKLSLALLQQSEFTEKTKESTRIRKENQIAGLQTQIGTQTTLLDDFYNGRLVAQGENITAGLAAENERYAQEKAIAQEARAVQEEEMRLSLGRMVLQQFEAWATIRGIPAEEMLKMKNQIAVDYGLMTEEGALAADLQIDIWEQWATDMNVSTKSVVAEMNTVSANAQAITRNLNLIPREINIDITTTERRREVTESIARRESQRGPGGGGANFAEGADFTVPRGFDNDSFPMHVSSGERVIVIPRDQNTTNNFNQTINTRSSSAAQAGFRVMQSMAGG